ncbi:7-cyano-7-deazaguanine synthase [Streptomyces sparsogenes]|uniref:7-cyano-7-deazaguanine synthase n=1 Tax=Streptomyces sparsogenes TaxID=67365 RepID=UPI0033EDB3DB
MKQEPQRYFWLSHPQAPAPAPPWEALSDDVYWESESRSPERSPLLAPAPGWAVDLHRVARAVFAADRHARRDIAFDHWTRRITLSVAVTDTPLWERAGRHLDALLRTTTGDVWDITFRRLEPGLTSRPSLTFSADDYAGEVALFSGGLDSLSWAVQRATVPTRRPLLLVCFGEKNQERLQQRVHQAVDRLRARPMRTIFQSQEVRRPEAGDDHMERSTRSRGFLFAAAAVRAAAAECVPRVDIPENGQLAVNPPLSAARIGSCSTRSVHPWTLHHLNLLIAAVGGSVRVTNPLAALTKGQVCRAAKDAGLPQAAAEATVSCGASPKNKPPKPDELRSANCGYCFPCLVRRSGLLHAYGRDDTPYAVAPWTLGPRDDRAEHWRALRRWLDGPSLTALDLIADTPLPPGARPEELLKVIHEGRKELRALVEFPPAQRRSA